MELTSFGGRIKARRKALDMTQEKLAELVGVKQGYISALENGERKKPSYDVVERLSEALNCSPRDLTGEQELGSLVWFWKSKFSVMSQGELLSLRRLSVEERAQWIAKAVVEAFGQDKLIEHTGMTDAQCNELLNRPILLSEDQANKLSNLDLPVNFLLSGDTGPTDEDLQVLLSSPDCGQWLRLFRKCQEENVLPSTLELLLRAALEARQAQ